MTARRLPAGWTPPRNVIDIGQLSFARLFPPPSTRALIFAADDDGTVRIRTVAPWISGAFAMTASHLTALIVLHTLTTSLHAAMACMTSESDPVMMLLAAQNNAAAWIHGEMQCAQEGV